MISRKHLLPANIDGLITGSLSDPATPGLTIEIRRSGKKIWLYRRRIAGSGRIVRVKLGGYPALSIAAARTAPTILNEQIEAGINPRAIDQEAAERAQMTVDVSHFVYVTAVREGRGSRAKRVNRPRTIADKIAIYQGDIAPTLGQRVNYDVTEADLTKLVLAKGKHSPVRANRLAAELKVFFGWASSLRGTEIGLMVNPATRLTDLKFAEAPRTRKLSPDEIGWFLRALAEEPRRYQRGMLILLLTAARLWEVIQAKSSELELDVWMIPADRTKNSRVHRIALGPWGLSLFRSSGEWLFPSTRVDGPQAPSGWYKARNRLLARMSDYAGQSIDNWTPHDMRRTARSNTKRLNIDFETAEAMLNHARRGLSEPTTATNWKTKSANGFTNGKRKSLRSQTILAWRQRLAFLLPDWRDRHLLPRRGRDDKSPEGARLHPGEDVSELEPWTAAMFAQPAAKLIFRRQSVWPTRPQTINLASR